MLRPLLLIGLLLIVAASGCTAAPTPAQPAALPEPSPEPLAPAERAETRAFNIDRYDR